MNPIAALRGCFGRSTRSHEDTAAPATVSSVFNARRNEQAAPLGSLDAMANANGVVASPRRLALMPATYKSSDQIGNEMYRRCATREARSLLEHHPSLAKLAGEQEVEEKLGPWALIRSMISAIEEYRGLSIDAAKAFDAFTDRLRDLARQQKPGYFEKAHVPAATVADVDLLARKALLAVGKNELTQHLIRAILSQEIVQLLREKDAEVFHSGMPKVELDQEKLVEYESMIDKNFIGIDKPAEIVKTLFNTCNLLKMYRSP